MMSSFPLIDELARLTGDSSYDQFTLSCPACRRKDLTGTPAGDIGIYWFCRRCGFRGDGLRVAYRAVTGDPYKAHEAIRILQGNTTRELTEMGVAARISGDLTDFIETHDRYCQVTSNALIVPNARVYGCLERSGLAPSAFAGAPAEKQQDLAKFFHFYGSYTKKNLREIGARVGEMLYEKAWRGAAVFVEQALPGLPCAYTVINSAGETAECPLGKTSWQPRMERGLINLETAARYSTVFLVNDLATFVAMARAWHIVCSEPPPFVCKPHMERMRPHTLQFLRNVNIVVVPRSEEPESRLFAAVAAAEIGNRGYVGSAYTPNMQIVAYTRTAEKTRAGWTAAGISALRDYAADRNPPDSLRAVLASIAARTEDLKAAGATSADFAKLKFCLPSESKIQTTRWQDRLIVHEEKRGWTVEGRCVCSSAIFLETAFSVGNKVMFSGYVESDKQVRFTAADAEIRKDPAAWLTELCVSNALPVPVIDPDYRKSLLDIAIAFHAPASLGAVGKVGWNEETRQFLTPAVCVADGVITIRDIASPALWSLPLGRVIRTTLPSAMTVAAWYGCAGFQHALFFIGALLSTICAGMTGEKTRGIMLPAPTPAVDAFARKLGLRRVVARVRSAEASDALRAFEADCATPLLLDGLSGPFRHYHLSYDLDRRIIAVADESERLEQLITGKWIFCPRFPGFDPEELGQLHELLLVGIARVQQLKKVSTLEPLTAPYCTALLANMLIRAYPDMDHSRADEAHTFGYDACGSLGVRYLVALIHAESLTGRQVLEAHDDGVRVSADRADDALRAVGVAHPEVFALDQEGPDLTMDAGGWIFGHSAVSEARASYAKWQLTL